MIMVTLHEYLVALKVPEKPVPDQFSITCQAYVTYYHDHIITMYHTVPVVDQCLIHLFDIVPRSVTVYHDVSVIKMLIRCEPIFHLNSPFKALQVE